MVPLLSQCILVFLKLLLNWDRGQAWHDGSLTVISAQFLRTEGSYINSHLSSQLTRVSLHLWVSHFYFIWGFVPSFHWPVCTIFFLPPQALEMVPNPSLLGGEHIFVGFWHSPHIAFLLFRLNMNLPSSQYSSSIVVLMLFIGSDRHLPLAHNTFYTTTFISVLCGVGCRILKCIP